jgi:hypothetical protein
LEHKQPHSGAQSTETEFVVKAFLSGAGIEDDVETGRAVLHYKIRLPGSFLLDAEKRVLTVK